MLDKAHSFPFLFANEYFKLLIPIITDLTENRTTQGLYYFTNNYLSVYEVTNYSLFCGRIYIKATLCQNFRCGEES